MSKKAPKAKQTFPESKYRPEYCEGIIKWAKRGPTFTFLAYADHLGVSDEALQRWARRYPEFKRAKNIAKRIQEKTMADIGLKGMQGKIRFFNGGVWCFWMAARFQGWRKDGPSEEDGEHELEFSGESDDADDGE